MYHFEITYTKSDKPRKNHRVYVSDDVGDLLSEFYSDNEIYALKYKSKVYRKLGRRRNSLINEILMKEFNSQRSIFSYKAGCTCGCSPGFIVTPPEGTPGKEYWVDIKVSYLDYRRFRELLIEGVKELKNEKRLQELET